MARLFSLQNTNPRHQILLAALLLIALAAFLVSRHNYQADASASSGGTVNLTTSHAQESEAPSASTEGASDSGQSSSSSATNVTVNGRHIDLPQNGSLSQTITDENGTTTINAQHSESSSTSSPTGQASNRASSTVNVDVKSSSVDSL